MGAPNSYREAPDSCWELLIILIAIGSLPIAIGSLPITIGSVLVTSQELSPPNSYLEAPDSCREAPNSYRELPIATWIISHKQHLLVFMLTFKSVTASPHRPGGYWGCQPEPKHACSLSYCQPESDARSSIRIHVLSHRCCTHGICPCSVQTALHSARLLQRCVLLLIRQNAHQAKRA